MLTLHLEAESLEELKAKAMAALGIAVNSVKAEAEAAYPDVDWEARQEWPVTALPQPVEAKPAPDRPKRGRPRAVKPPVVAPEDTGNTWEDIASVPLEDIDLSSFENPAPILTPPVDTLANEKLKAEVIDRLADLFTAGKVKLLRSLLDTYGSGAKTFAEIDPGVFPKIRDAMQKGIDS